MARDFEDIHDIGDLNDGELKDLVLEHLGENRAIDVEDFNVHVEKGRVRLIGRVGTEMEYRIAERELTDVLGLTNVSNELIVDSLRRAESSEDIEEHLEEEEEQEGLLLGDKAVPIDTEAELLEEDLDARLFGTTDVQRSIADGTPWIPPTSPTPEGAYGDDAPPSVSGGDR